MMKTYYNTRKSEIDSKRSHSTHSRISFNKYGSFSNNIQRKKFEQKSLGPAPLMKRCEAVFKFKCRQRSGNEKSVRGPTTFSDTTSDIDKSKYKNTYEEISGENLSETSTSDSNSNGASDQVISKPIIVSDKCTKNKLHKFGALEKNFELLSTSFEAQKDLFETFQSILDKQLFTSCSGRYFNYSNIVGKTNSSMCKQYLRNNFFYSNKEKIENKKGNGCLEKPSIELFDTILQYNPIIDMWPIFLSDLECSMIPSLNCFDSINWDKIDDLPFYETKCTLDTNPIGDPLQFKDDSVSLNNTDHDDDNKPFSKMNEIEPYGVALEDGDQCKNQSLLQQSLSIYDDHIDNFLSVSNKVPIFDMQCLDWNRNISPVRGKEPTSLSWNKTKDLLKTEVRPNSFSGAEEKKQDSVTNFLDENECCYSDSKTSQVSKGTSTRSSEMESQSNKHNSSELLKNDMAGQLYTEFEEDNPIIFVEDFDVNREVFDVPVVIKPNVNDSFSEDNASSLPAITSKVNADPTRVYNNKSSFANTTLSRTASSSAKSSLTLAEFKNFKNELKKPIKYVTSQGESLEISLLKNTTGQEGLMNLKTLVKPSVVLKSCDKSIQGSDFIPKLTFNSTSSPSSSKNTVTVTSTVQNSSAKNVVPPFLRYYPINKNQKTIPNYDTLPKPPPLKFNGTDRSKFLTSLSPPLQCVSRLNGNLKDKNKCAFSSNISDNNSKCTESDDKIETSLSNNALFTFLSKQSSPMGPQINCTEKKNTPTLSNSFTVHNEKTFVIKSYQNKKLKSMSKSFTNKSVQTTALSSNNSNSTPEMPPSKCSLPGIEDALSLSKVETQTQEAKLANNNLLKKGENPIDQHSVLYQLLIPASNSSTLNTGSTFSSKITSHNPFYSNSNTTYQVVSNTNNFPQKNNLDQSFQTPLFQEGTILDSSNKPVYLCPLLVVSCSDSSNLNSVSNSKQQSLNSLYTEGSAINPVISKTAIKPNFYIDQNVQVPVIQEDVDMETNWFNPVIENCISLSNNSTNDFLL